MTKTITFDYASGESRCKTYIDDDGRVQIAGCDYLLATVETPEDDFELYAESYDYSDEERENGELTEEGDARRLAQLIEAIKEQIDALPITGFTFSFPDGSEYTK